MKKSIIMSIDPGTISLGYCLFRSDKPWKYDLIKQKSRIPWHIRAKNVTDALDVIYYRHLPSLVLCEIPEHWGGFVGSAARESGSVFKLAFLVGCIYDRLSQYTQVELIPPSKWKGQLKKSTVRKRLMEKLPSLRKKLSKMDHNVIDAIGIGVYWLQEGQYQ